MCTVNMAGRKWLEELKSWQRGKMPCMLMACFTVTMALFANPVVGDSVQTVADSNWTVILQGQWMLVFYAPWCPACQQIKADWEEFGKRSEALGISVGKVDVTQQPGLSGRFLVTTLPTIFHANDGSFRRYLSSRAVEDFQSYVVDKKWEAVEPVPEWKSPSSFVMTMMSGLFRLSVWIRQIHSYLTETLGIPVWGSYLIFALVTLVTGLLLGLILVLIADCICPSRPRRRDRKSEVEVKEDGSEGDIEDTLTEERQLSDAENESAKLSGEEESTGEEVLPSEGEAGAPDMQTPEGASESMVRKRKPQGAEPNET
ncbi:thioredoxin-related transmembrane protein 4 [Paramormyrops kingsleyae]|uniref:thioredoxin-related transmembrane protein 4 n=1 Tax=Paramormyrops kingsleyae TaxID=1676925 RepID=UPI003B96D73B